jgi:4-diphosphocytidyl-2-C-methyl-D-erythritol kinase
MKEISLKAYAKINLSLDVLGVLPNGYHEVRMIMQQLELHDVVTVRWQEAEAAENLQNIGQNTVGHSEIALTTNRADLPVDRDNIAYQAAALMFKKFIKSGRVEILIEKNIPVAAGLAGGSANGAAVLHGLNYLWDTNLTLSELCDLGVKLGADVPFCIMGQARANENLGVNITGDSLAAVCALAEGIGQKLQPLPAFDCWILLSKPPIGVSTAEVYKGIDKEMETEGILHPNTEELIQGLYEKNYEKITPNMVNILELFSLKRYPIIVYTKHMLEKESSSLRVLMSGSGPTVFAVYLEKSRAEEAFMKLCEYNKETFITKTLI